MQVTEKIDLSLLPEEGRKELLDFYKFLLNKYSIGSNNKEKCKTKPKDISKFAGILKKTSIDPLKYQKALRNEWDY